MEQGNPVYSRPFWCFDAKLFYTGFGFLNVTEDYYLMREHLARYWDFSYPVNGLFTTGLVLLGLIGNLMLLLQISSNRVFSRRLSIHLSMICIWDMIFLLCCLITYSIPVLIYGHMWFYGWMAYVLYFLQPLACICGTATIWHVLAITFERFLAVYAPLKQRRVQAKYGIWWIVGAIVVGAIILNVVPVPFEKMFYPCLEYVPGNDLESSTVRHSLLLGVDLNYKAFVAYYLHLVPDLFFRAPVPTIAILWLTYQTLQLCKQREKVGTSVVILPTSRNIETRLYLLAAKFIVCNFLFLISIVLIERYGIGAYLKKDEALAKGGIHMVKLYMNSFYLTDMSNFLLAFHAATNWLLFYNFTVFTKKLSMVATTSMTSIQKSQAITEGFAKFTLQFIAAKKHQIGREILAKVCWEMPVVKQSLLPNYNPHNYSLLSTNPDIQELGEKLGDFIETCLEWFGDPTIPYSGIREICREMTASHFEYNPNFTCQQWQQIRGITVSTVFSFIIKTHNTKEYTKSEIEYGLIKAFNFLLSEIKNAALCAAVEESRRKNSRPIRSASMYGGDGERRGTIGGLQTSRSLRECPTSRNSNGHTNNFILSKTPMENGGYDCEKLLDPLDDSIEIESEII